MTGILLKRKAEENLRPSDIEQEVMGRQGQRLVWCVYKPRKAKDYSCHQKPGGRKRTDSPPELTEGTSPGENLVSVFRPPEPCEKNVLLLEATHFVVIYGDGHGKLIHTPSQRFPPGSLWSNLHPCLSDLVLFLCSSYLCSLAVIGSLLSLA